MAKKRAKKKAEREMFRQMPEADLLELRNATLHEIAVICEERNSKTGTLQRINQELGSRKSGEVDRVVVTDHAIVRYLQRVEGLDITRVRDKIVEMTRRAIRRDKMFMDDPETGLVIVRKEGSDSVATILEPGSVSSRLDEDETTA
jgi:hypothetical protein